MQGELSGLAVILFPFLNISFLLASDASTASLLQSQHLLHVLLQKVYLICVVGAVDEIAYYILFKVWIGFSFLLVPLGRLLVVIQKTSTRSVK